MALGCVGELGVADGVGCCRDGGGHFVVALNAAADGPFDGGATADGGLPVGVGFAKEVGPDEGGAAAVGAVDDDDRVAGQGDVAVDGADGGIVPGADISEVDVGEDLGREAEVVADLGQVIDGDDSADDGGELQQLCGHLAHVGVGEGDVRGGEGYLVLVKLLDAGLGADAVVADLNVGVVLAEGLDPYLVERCGEGSAGGLKDSDRAFRGRAGEGDEKLSGDLVGEIATDAGGCG